MTSPSNPTMALKVTYSANYRVTGSNHPLDRSLGSSTPGTAGHQL
jgi:hypothetical protein